ncbi:MAG: CRISPR system precrRNA processing endoribonuclease RAMP protein Cas6 [SAR324 cluster bacterium]|nr:CRISPR system precrRNA processing endoribonuclease RAMP protein Cas6 [SAR324 cluster bacterium]
MKYSRFDITMVAEQATSLPIFKGSMIRGALGHALKSVVCAVREKNCQSCLLFTHCIYARTFESKPDTASTFQSQRPHPYALELSPSTQTLFAEGDPLEYSLILIGEFYQYLPYFVYSIERLGEQGLGKKQEQHRAQFLLQKICCNDQIIYDSNHRTLPPSIPFRSLTLGGAEHPSVNSLTLHFLTPLRVKNQGKLVSADALDFPILFRTLMRRIRTLWQEYSDIPLVVEESHLYELSTKIETGASDLRWHDQIRYSNRQQSLQKLGGLLGSITFTGDLSQYLPFLEMGKLLHIGKETTFGLGQYACHEPHG